MQQQREEITCLQQLLKEQREKTAALVAEVVTSKQAEMEAELASLLRSLAAKEGKMRGEIEALHDRMEEKERFIARLKEVSVKP